MGRGGKESVSLPATGVPTIRRRDPAAFGRANAYSTPALKRVSTFATMEAKGKPVKLKRRTRHALAFSFRAAAPGFPGGRLVTGARGMRQRASYRWLMRLAMVAAPKPLSMLTTETPEAQLFNMPRSAAIPPKLAP